MYQFSLWFMFFVSYLINHSTSQNSKESATHFPLEVLYHLVFIYAEFYFNLKTL